jgi:hypothetical protein
VLATGFIALSRRGTRKELLRWSRKRKASAQLTSQQQKMKTVTRKRAA